MFSTPWNLKIPKTERYGLENKNKIKQKKEKAWNLASHLLLIICSLSSFQHWVGQGTRRICYAAIVNCDIYVIRKMWYITDLSGEGHLPCPGARFSRVLHNGHYQRRMGKTPCLVMDLITITVCIPPRHQRLEIKKQMDYTWWQGKRMEKQSDNRISLGLLFTTILL